MTTPDNNTIDVSFPTFVRLNVATTDLADGNKSNAVTITETATANYVNVTQDLTSSTAKLECTQDLIAQGKLIVTNPKSDISFGGRVNLADNTITYNPYNNGGGEVAFTDINSRQGKQYVPYGLYKNGAPKISMRSALSGGHVGSGDTRGWGAEVLWDAYTKQREDLEDGAVTFSSANRGKLYFEASPAAPVLFRLSVFMRKNGDWLDNGAGGRVMLYVNTKNSAGKTMRRLLGIAVCLGSTWYTTVPMFWCAATYYATSSGFFQLIVGERNFRVSSLSWSVVRLPVVP
ncbi:hypothetical protein [Chlamydia trachomatis]|uniref:Putative membrane protein n=2 Tax=Chlamydia trachomatis TaxID=813 RepID=A0A6H2W1E1_CHLTB|nr:hypothetical protein [Chlamydia trachomatis]AKC30370.1 hypothetical protein L2bCS78408_02115 [Chlamydia trachomatis]AKC31280.1 hypothetical protein L2bCS1908_02115 [Chlamydia trachomatis]UYF97985.1 hypothetical protein ODL24_00565 [Chlamydia trachomatis]CAP06793.1 putative membrane protein [Chlamydia trachomatis L2b/UCH-1/proctitis]CCP51434.1 hypothetical protein L2B8200_00148 [Chlamydia trachomatis L2b/8200/07]